MAALEFGDTVHIPTPLGEGQPVTRRVDYAIDMSERVHSFYESRRKRPAIDNLTVDLHAVASVAGNEFLPPEFRKSFVAKMLGLA